MGEKILCQAQTALVLKKVIPAHVCIIGYACAAL